MKKVRRLTGSLMLLAWGTAVVHSQDISFLKAGGLKINPNSYGHFSTVSHQNKDSSFTRFVNFRFYGALWVGAITADGDTLVSCGDGNEIIRESEWRPVPSSYNLTTKDNGEVSARTSYNDQYSIKGHVPLNISVKQEIYAETSGNYLILRFSLYRLAAQPQLVNVYVGFFSDVDVPETNGKIDAQNDGFGATIDGTTGYIHNQSNKQATVPFLGVSALNIDFPLVSAWKRLPSPATDQQRYRYLTGNSIKSDLGDYRFTIGGGSSSVGPTDTLHFDIALIYGADLKSLEDNLLAARQFYQDLLPSNSSLKTLNSPALMTTTEAPQKFALHQNYPNPIGQSNLRNGHRGGIIPYDISEPSEVSITVYDMLGRPLRTLISSTQAPGKYSLLWDSRNNAGDLLPSGLYLYTLRAKTQTGAVYLESRKLLIIR
jgi:hypothetical protein